MVTTKQGTKHAHSSFARGASPSLPLPLQLRLRSGSGSGSGSGFAAGSDLSPGLG